MFNLWAKVTDYYKSGTTRKNTVRVEQAVTERKQAKLELEEAIRDLAIARSRKSPNGHV